MEFLPRQFLFGVCTIALAIGLTDAVHGETAPVVVGLARCSDCTRKNVNAEAAFKGLQVAIKCKNDKGEYESKAMGQVEKSGAFSVPLAADLIAVDGELKKDCLAQLHDTSSAPCPGQEPSKIVAAQHSHDGKTTFVALAGKVHQPSAECASAFLCDPLHKHHWFFFHKPLIVPPKHDHDHDHPHLPVIKPPVTIPPKHDHDHDHDHSHDHNHDHDHNHGHDHDHDHDNDHGHDHDHDHDQDHDHDHEHDHDNNHDHGHDHDQDHDHDHDHDHDQGHDHAHDHDHDQGHDHDHDHDNDQGHDHDHDHDHSNSHGHGLSLPPVAEPPRTAVYMPMPPKATPIYRPPARRDAVTEPQLFKKMFPFLKKLPFFPSAEQNSKP